jgi:hypothetical protein
LPQNVGNNLSDYIASNIRITHCGTRFILTVFLVLHWCYCARFWVC